MSKKSKKLDALEEQSPAVDRVDNGDEGAAARIFSPEQYQAQLRLLQIELVKLQRHNIRSANKILIVLEGRDAAGKDGSIKRIVKHLSPRETRVVALGKPSDRDLSAWYFQRFVPYLPVAQELVLFNRSWYNRAGVEPVMNFCSKDQHEEFLLAVPTFESMLVSPGITLLKYYLDISKDEQTLRLAARKNNPLKAWKSSAIDAVAVKHWKAYSKARDTMLLRTHTPIAPWHIVRTDDKHLARINLIRSILSRVHYTGKKSALARPDVDIAFEFTPDCIDNIRLAR